jgi:hypothetical protein
MRMVSNEENYEINTGLVQLNVGKLSINNLDVTSVSLEGNDIIQVNNGAEDISIKNS